MPIDPYAALSAMVRAEVARSCEPSVADPSPERHEPRKSDARGEADAGGEEDPAIANRP